MGYSNGSARNCGQIQEHASMKRFMFGRREITSNFGCEKQETVEHTSVRKDTRSRVDALTGDPALRCNNMPPRNRGHGYVPKT